MAELSCELPSASFNIGINEAVFVQERENRVEMRFVEIKMNLRKFRLNHKFCGIKDF